MKYFRDILPRIESRLFRGKVLVIYGPRQAGKTTLVKYLLSQHRESSVYLSCDEPDVRGALTDATSTGLKAFFGKRRLVVIDEAQRVRNIGLTLKLAADTLPEIQVIATGSSSFELSNQVTEPLTGRAMTYFLFPLSIGELRHEHDDIELRRLLERRMILGMYPEIVCTEGEDARELVAEIAGSYLYKDILSLREIRRPEVLERLLQALALQIGNEVSFTELGSLLAVDKSTIASYLDLLEKAFIVFRLPPFSRNLRNELKKLRKVYFWDTGIRNAVLNNFGPLDLRTDAGALWENFAIAERLKANRNRGLHFNAYFWRTHQQQEIDYLEEHSGQLRGAEMKWSPRKKLRVPKVFRDAYPEASVTRVSPDELIPFLCDGE